MSARTPAYLYSQAMTREEYLQKQKEEPHKFKVSQRRFRQVERLLDYGKDQHKAETREYE